MTPDQETSIIVSQREFFDDDDEEDDLTVFEGAELLLAWLIEFNESDVVRLAAAAAATAAAVTAATDVASSSWFSLEAAEVFHGDEDSEDKDEVMRVLFPLCCWPDWLAKLLTIFRLLFGVSGVVGVVPPVLLLLFAAAPPLDCWAFLLGGGDVG